MLDLDVRCWMLPFCSLFFFGLSIQCSFMAELNDLSSVHVVSRFMAYEEM